MIIMNLLRIYCCKYWCDSKIYHWFKILYNFLNQELFTIENSIWDLTIKSIVTSKQSFTLTISTLPYSFWIKLSCICYLIEILRLYFLFIWSISSCVDVFGLYSFLHKLQIITTTYSISSYFLYIYFQTAEIIFPLSLPLLSKEVLSSVDSLIILPLLSEIDSLVLSSEIILSSKLSMSMSSSISSKSICSFFDMVCEECLPRI